MKFSSKISPRKTFLSLTLLVLFIVSAGFFDQIFITAILLGSMLIANSKIYNVKISRKTYIYMFLMFFFACITSVIENPDFYSGFIDGAYEQAQKLNYPDPFSRSMVLLKSLYFIFAGPYVIFMVLMIISLTKDEKKTKNIKNQNISVSN